MCRLVRSFAARTKWHSIAIWVTTWEFWTVTKAQTRPSKCADSPDPSLLAQNGIQSPFESPHENFELWRRLRLDQANVQTRQSHRCSHEWHPKIMSITITNCRQTHGTERNSHTTITRHQEDKLSKAASSFSSPSRWSQNKNGHKVKKYRTITESCNGSNNQQQINNNRISALEQTAAYISGLLKCILLVPNLCPRFCCCWSTKILSSHGGFFTIVMYHNGQTISLN